MLRMKVTENRFSQKRGIESSRKDAESTVSKRINKKTSNVQIQQNLKSTGSIQSRNRMTANFNSDLITIVPEKV